MTAEPNSQGERSGLDKIDLFADLPAEALDEIERIVTWHSCVEGDVVFDKDSDALEVYFVVTGAVRILAHQAEDREVALADVVAGNYFGELAAIDRMARSAKVVATRPSLLASIDGDSFIDVMNKHPQVALKVIERLTRIIRNLDTRVTKLSTLSDQQRVTAELVRLAAPDPSRPESWHIADLPNHREIAAWAGTGREIVAQVIGELAREGVVKRKSMGLVICDLSRLQLMAKGEAA